MKKLKVLVSAYACEPDKGSEPGVGWHWAKQIARFHEVWVITRANNKKSIERELRRNPDPNLHFVYYDVPQWLSFWKKNGRGLYLYYLLWQIGTYRIAQRQISDSKFDLIHCVTFGNFWLPTFLPFLPVPFVWGPVGGGEQIPRQFRKEYTLKAKLVEFSRDVILATLKINPLFLYSCKRSILIIARTEETLRRIPLQYRYKTVKLLETGTRPRHIDTALKQQVPAIIQIMAVGRLIHWKGFDLALKAFAKVYRKHEQVQMLIAGDGPEERRLKQLSNQLGVFDQVVFAGHISIEQVKKKLEAPHKAPHHLGDL